VDSPSPVETLTDAEGRFRLAGLSDGPVLIMAAAEGMATGCVLSQSGAEDARIVLEPRAEGRMGEPIPPEGTVLSKEEVRGKLMPAIEALLAQRDLIKDEWQQEQILELLARLDPDAAFKAAEEAKWPTDGVNMALGRQLLTEDFTEAMALLRQTRDPMLLAFVLTEAAAGFVNTNPGLAARCTQEALLAAQAMQDAATKAAVIAISAGILRKLGDPSAEEKLREAMALAQNIGVTEWAGYARGLVAEQTSVMDLDSALALIRTIEDEDERDRHLANIVRRVAKIDPDHALALASEITSAAARDRAIASATSFFPADRLQEALAAARALTRSSTRAMALARLCSAVPRDQVPAMLEEAADDLSKGAEAEGDFLQPAVGLASLAVRARQLGYSGHEEFALQALTQRQPGSMASPADAGMGGRADLALALALTRPDLARHVLEATLRVAGGANKLRPYDLSRLIEAAAPIDPDLAIRLLDVVPLSAETDPTRRVSELHSVGAALLSSPEERMMNQLTRYHGESWIPMDVDD
jgi:hypothetical protein